MKIIERYVVFAIVFLAYIAGLVFQPLIIKGLDSTFLIRVILLALCVFSPIIFLSLTLISLLSDDRSKRREFEWELALIIARKSEPRIIGKISEIIESQAIDTFKEVKDQEGKNLEARAQIKAKHILEVWNQLFQEEKDESQK